ncbi:MAG: CoA-binding protein [Promethearchaeota archaeon]|nr:MAG: CoA-binding protein [Candidatus Lokiarchaeota archaeon]
MTNIIDNPSENHFLYKILNPESICIFGANNDLLQTMGSMQLRNLRAGFKGTIYPIHPKLETVQGLKAYKSVLELPETPDLAFIILRPQIVPQVLEECGKKGIKRAIITSGGFRESRHSDGVELSEKIDEIAEKYDIRFIGPNCLGVFNGWYGSESQEDYINTFWIYNPHSVGNISIASQSGTIAAQTSWICNHIGAKVGKSLSVGNEKNIDIVDILDFFKKDPQTSVIGLYIEEIKRGEKFIKVVKELTPKKPIVAIYAGGTNAAARSIMSHTGSIAGDTRIYDAVFKETGIISTTSINDFFYFLRTLSYAQKYNVYPKGKRVGIITDSGGSAAIMTKMCEVYGLKVPEFSKELQAKISKYIPHTASGSNPIDITFFKNFFDFYVTLPKLIIKSGEVDSVLFDGIFDFGDVFNVVEKSGAPLDEQMKQFIGTFYDMIIDPIQRLVHKKSVPLFYSGPQLFTFAGYREFLKHDTPMFELWDQPPKCLNMLVNYAQYRQRNAS